MASRPSSSPEEAPKTLEPLKLARVVRNRVNRVLMAIPLAGAAIGFGAGEYAQDEYRKATGFDPDRAEEVDQFDVEEEAQAAREEVAPDGVMPTAETPEQEGLKESWKKRLKKGGEKLKKAVDKSPRLKEAAKRGKKWLDDAKELKEKAKEEARKAFDIAKDTPAGERAMKEIAKLKEKAKEGHQKTIGELRDFKHSTLELGDNIAFYGPLLTIFLASLLFAGAYRILNGKSRLDDEAVQKNQNEMLARLNELTVVHNTGSLTDAQRQEVAQMLEGYLDGPSPWEQ